MIQNGRRLSARECSMVVATGMTIVGVLVFQQWLLPVYDQWSALRDLVAVQANEHAKLVHNLSVKEEVDARFADLGEAAIQTKSDEITLSQFLRDVEAAARLPSLVLINMKPMPIEQKNYVKIYPVRLSVAGKMQDVLKFVSGLLHGSTVVGLESFSIRGVQGGHSVECTLSFWMVRLIPDKVVTPAAARAG